jgi:hypothetical protein
MPLSRPQGLHRPNRGSDHCRWSRALRLSVIVHRLLAGSTIFAAAFAANTSLHLFHAKAKPHPGLGRSAHLRQGAKPNSPKAASGLAHGGRTRLNSIGNSVYSVYGLWDEHRMKLAWSAPSRRLPYLSLSAFWLSSPGIDHLGFEVHYLYRGVVRKYRLDFLVHLRSGLMLIS